MRHRFSNAFRSIAVVSAGVVLGLAAAVPAVTVGASSASAALRPIVGCGFHFGPITNEGAAGTIFYMAQLEPANPAQRCTTAVTFTASARPTSGGSYTTIDHNPLTATQTVSFAPGRLQPQLTLAWQLFHCADPAVPGAITFSAGGQTGATPITPSSCFTMGHSSFASTPVPQTPSIVGIAPTSNGQGYRLVNDHGALEHFGNATAFTAAASHSPVVGIASAAHR